MSDAIRAIIAERGICEILHFTTENGALGFLATRALLPRAELATEKQLEHIMRNNCTVRKDPAWAGHNSMSVTRINSKFFAYSSRTHGTDLWWCILAFSPEILTHPRVVFSTGNNTWPRARKNEGADGLRNMFAERVPGTYDSTIHRRSDTPLNEPTTEEAEVLYPGRIALDHLLFAYFRDQEHADIFAAQADTLDLSFDGRTIRVEPERFSQRTYP